MLLRFLSLLGFFALIWVFLPGCNQKENAAPQMPVSPMERPLAFGKPVFGADASSVTDSGFALGRALFYDPALSLDSTVSCGTCHKQEAAFADPGNAISSGINSIPTDRNSPTIQNLAWRSHFMWDGRFAALHEQPRGPIGNASEMGPDFEATMRKVAAYPRYKAMSKTAYKSDTLTSTRLLDALAQFMGSLVSAHSRYDTYQAGDTNALTAQEKLGLHVFMTKGCNNCHTDPLFTSDGFRNNGLEDYSTDGGRVNFTKQEADRGKFSIPSLRNAAVSGPYMHNGIYPTLEDVVAFYRTGIQETPNRDALIPPTGFNMTDTEAAGLVAFLKALNDEAFLKNPKFKKP